MKTLLYLVSWAIIAALIYLLIATKDVDDTDVVDNDHDSK